MLAADSNLVIGLLAGELSGDNLGANLIRAMKESKPNTRFVGIGGPAMIAEGMECWTDIEKLSVNGFVDPIKRLPDLIKILVSTRDMLIKANVDCFIGVDFNFFNLLLEGMLKKRGIKTVHYVSPTVWAWRQGRIKSIAKKVDLMLTLYPFELDIYHDNGINAVCVGHPKADEIEMNEGESGKADARKTLEIENDSKLVAILPGSRKSEVAFSGPDFLAAASGILERQPDVQFIIPAANEKRKGQLEEMLNLLDTNLPLEIVLGNSKTVMQASDVVLVNSGTATLEAMLLKKPMVMSYRLGAITYAIISRLVKTEFFALPNILSKKALVPELIQDAATPAALAGLVLELLENRNEDLLREFEDIHRLLRKNSGKTAATAIMELLEEEYVPA